MDPNQMAQGQVQDSGDTGGGDPVSDAKEAFHSYQSEISPDNKGNQDDHGQDDDEDYDPGDVGDDDDVGAGGDDAKSGQNTGGDVDDDGEDDQGGDDADQDDDTDDDELDDDDTPIDEINVKYSLDDLRCPRDYKPFVKEKIDQVLKEAKTQSSKLNEAYKESNAALANAVVNIIQSKDPLKTIRDYASQLGQAGNVSPELIQNLDRRIAENANGAGNQGQEGGQDAANQGGDQPAQFDFKAMQKRLDQELTKIEDKYWPLMESIEDPKQTRQLFSQMEREKMALVDAVNNAKQQAVLMAFYNKLIKPNFDEQKQRQDEAKVGEAQKVRTAKVELWNDADRQLTKKIGKDWSKYKTKVKKVLKQRYRGELDRANATGQGHERLFRDIYLLVSQKERIRNAKRPNRGRPGHKPKAKHIDVQRTGGNIKEDIKNRIWGDLIPEKDEYDY